MNKEDVKDILSKYNKKELLQFYDSFNSWEFPEELKKYEPSNFEEMPDFIINKNIKIETKDNNETFKLFIGLLKELLTEKEILKHHHIYNLDRNLFQFYYWWYKRKIEKYFSIGFYSKKNKEMITEVLRSIYEQENQSQLEGIYSNKYSETEVNDKNN